MRILLFSFWFVLAAASLPVMAQRDTSYCVSYGDKITSRFYLSKKYTAFNLRNSNENLNINYRPNTTLNLGVGATYKWATLNLAYGFRFLNPDKGKGNTDYLDLQAHAYGKKLTFDFLGQLYKGFFLSPRGNSISSANSYYLRPDMKVLITGLSAQYVLNHDRFSYQAAFHQSERQKRSAGSLLMGFETYAGSIRGDSTLLPADVTDSTIIEGSDKISFFELGPNVGYAYSFIFLEHFFVTASATVSLDYGKTSINGSAEPQQISGFSPNLFLRGFWGYNSDRWAVGFVYIHNGVNLSASDGLGRRVALNTGNFRLNIVRRLSPGKRVKTLLKLVDNISR